MTSAPPIARDPSEPARPNPILLVEDDAYLSAEITRVLQAAGHAVVHAGSGAQADAVMRSCPVDLIITDRLLPDLDGIDMVRRMRLAGQRLPVLVISALVDVDERIAGLRAGGDDYLPKPFAMGELVARAEALLRRPFEPRETVLRGGALTLDLLTRTVFRDDRAIELRPREFKLLEYLVRHAGQTVTRAMLLENVWNYRFMPDTNLIDVHMGKLRRQIELPGEPPLITAVRGVGFVYHAHR